MSVVAASSKPPTAGSARDDFIDLCRAFSLLIVVMWHWVFTIVVWRKSGPSANSPLGFTDNLWILTWFLQVMPLFFFVGGYAHLQLWTKLRGGPHGRRAGAVDDGRATNQHRHRRFLQKCMVRLRPIVRG